MCVRIRAYYVTDASGQIRWTASARRHICGDANICRRAAWPRRRPPGTRRRRHRRQRASNVRGPPPDRQGASSLQAPTFRTGIRRRLMMPHQAKTPPRPRNARLAQHHLWSTVEFIPFLSPRQEAPRQACEHRQPRLRLVTRSTCGCKMLRRYRCTSRHASCRRRRMG